MKKDTINQDEKIHIFGKGFVSRIHKKLKINNTISDKKYINYIVLKIK